MTRVISVIVLVVILSSLATTTSVPSARLGEIPESPVASRKNLTELPWNDSSSPFFANFTAGFLGANQIDIMDYPAYSKNATANVETLMRTASESGIKVLRIYLYEFADYETGYNSSSTWEGHSLTFWNNNCFSNFSLSCYSGSNFSLRMQYWSWVIGIAHREGIRILVTLTDFCCSSQYPSARSYFQARPFAEVSDASDTTAFENYIREVVRWNNTYTGKMWADDPAIFGWDIANEPQLNSLHQTCSSFDSWLTTVSSYLRSLDPNHPITVGFDPGELPTGYTGSCAVLFQVPSIDFNSVHYSHPYEPYPTIGAAVQALKSDGKIVVVEEGDVGLNQSGMRPPPPLNSSYVAQFKAYIDQAFCAGAAGFMFWEWGIPQSYDWPIYWAHQNFSINDTGFASMLQSYVTPYQVNVTTPYSSATGSGCYARGSTTVISLAGGRFFKMSQSTREVFVGWKGTGNGSYSGAEQTANVTVLGPITEVAEWDTQYLVNLEQSSGGTVSMNQSSPWVDAGSTVTLTANSDDGWKFEDWVGNGAISGSSEQVSVSVVAPITEEAIFYPELVIGASDGGEVTYSGGGASGSVVSGTTSQLFVPVGSTVNLIATPANGYQFVGWNVSSSGATIADRSSASAPATITGPGSATAEFHAIAITTTIASSTTTTVPPTTTTTTVPPTTTTTVPPTTTTTTAVPPPPSMTLYYAIAAAIVVIVVVGIGIWASRRKR